MSISNAQAADAGYHVTFDSVAARALPGGFGGQGREITEFFMNERNGSAVFLLAGDVTTLFTDKNVYFFKQSDGRFSACPTNSLSAQCVVCEDCSGNEAIIAKYSTH